MGWGEPDRNQRLDIGEIIDLAEAGEEYVIERAGKPVAVVLGLAQYQALKAADDDLETADEERRLG